MSADFEIASPLPGAAFGATVKLARPIAQALPGGLPEALADAGGLLLIPGLGEIAAEPRLLLALSRLLLVIIAIAIAIGQIVPYWVGRELLAAPVLVVADLDEVARDDLDEIGRVDLDDLSRADPGPE